MPIFQPIWNYEETIRPIFDVDRVDHETSGNLLPQECGDSLQFANRVFGGDFTSISEFPWYTTSLTCLDVALYDLSIAQKYI